MASKSTILKAIKEKCREDCCAGDKASWINCSIKDCSLFSYRFGRGSDLSSIKGLPKKDIQKNDKIIEGKFTKSTKKTIVEGGLTPNDLKKINKKEEI